MTLLTQVIKHICSATHVSGEINRGQFYALPPRLTQTYSMNVYTVPPTAKENICDMIV